MEKFQYNDFSYGDNQLSTQINQALQEYDTINQKLAVTKKRFNPILNNDFPYKTPLRYNNRLTRNTPFISANKNDYDYSFRSSLRGNYNYNNNKMFDSRITNTETNDLLKEFKRTLEKSQIIKDDLLKMNSNLRLNRRNKNKKYNYWNKKNIDSSFQYFPLKIFNNNYLEEEKSSTSNGGNTIEFTSNRKDISESFHKKQSIKKDENQKNKKDEKEKKKLENELNNLINKYQEIKKENRILEFEIANYKKMANQYINLGKSYKIKFNNKYSQKTINELEQSLHQNMQNNCLIIDTILKTQNNNELLSAKNDSLAHNMNINFEKIEKKTDKMQKFKLLTKKMNKK